MALWGFLAEASVAEIEEGAHGGHHAAAGELHRDWRNDVDGLGALFSNHIPDYRNLINSYVKQTQK